MSVFLTNVTDRDPVLYTLDLSHRFAHRETFFSGFYGTIKSDKSIEYNGRLGW